MKVGKIMQLTRVPSRRYALLILGIILYDVLIETKD